jgi:hypothetical protein
VVRCSSCSGLHLRQARPHPPSSRDKPIITPRGSVTRIFLE